MSTENPNPQGPLEILNDMLIKPLFDICNNLLGGSTAEPGHKPCGCSAGK